MATLLRSRRETLAALMTREMGKPITAALAEIEKCAAACQWAAENGAKILEPRIVASDATRSLVRYDPIGPILAIMPWNFPFWQVYRFAVGALVAGNTAILKHAPNVPGCAEAIEQLFAEAGFGDGVMVSIRIADNSEAQRLVEDQRVRAVTLTGSTRAGIAVASAAAMKLKRTVLELGGSDAFIVLADADVESAAKHAAMARCINSGQSCIAAKRFIVERPVFDDFCRAMVDAMNGLKIGDPMDWATEIGPLAREDLLENIERQCNESVAAGAELLCGGHRLKRPGFYFEPTLLSRVTAKMPAVCEETFGPLAAVMAAQNRRHAIELANQSEYGLGASIWTRDTAAAEAMAGELECGSVFINGIVKSDPRLPFGGIKHSGWGRELSAEGVREFTNVKTVWAA
jgi:succinate-semialdehyde dehydrogenase/glutarate-semialdehyde dehydrogenase